MPYTRENIKGILENKSDENTSAVINSTEKYSKRSPIRKAYEAGVLPVDHQRLIEAIKSELGNGAREGNIQLEKVLQATGYLRASALKMLRHMQNFGVLETEPKYRATWIKILDDNI